MAGRKSIQDALQKWQSRTQGAGQFYSQGIQQSRDWAANAVAAGPARDQGLQQAMADGRIDRGIQRVGTAGWRQKTLAKGPQAWQQGVAQAGNAYAAGMARTYQMLDAGDAAIASMPRGGFANNMARMTAYLQAVHNAKEQLAATG